MWKESIALVSYQLAQEILAPQSFDIWVLMKNDSGDHGTGSWTKHLTIGPMEGVEIPLLYPLVFWKSDETFT